MSSLFNSYKSKIKPSKICKKPIPGNPQPPSGPPDTFSGTWFWQLAAGGPAWISITQLRFILQGGPDNWDAAAEPTPGTIVDFNLNIVPGTTNWAARGSIQPPTGPLRISQWHPQIPTSLNPWFQDRVQASLAGLFIVSDLQFSS